MKEQYNNEFEFPKFSSRLGLIIVFYKILTLATSEIVAFSKQCDNASPILNETVISMPLSLWKVDAVGPSLGKAKLVCNGCKESIFHVEKNHSDHLRTFQVNILQNKNSSDGVPRINFVLISESQNYQSEISLSVAITDDYTSCNYCLMTRLNNAPPYCDITGMFPILRQSSEVLKLSFLISIDSSKNIFYFTSNANGKMQHYFQSKIIFSLERYQMPFTSLHTIVDSIFESRIDRSTNMDYLNITDRSSHRIESCGRQSMLCLFPSSSSLLVQSTTRITETGITNPTRTTDKSATTTTCM